MNFLYNPDKNAELFARYGINFEDIIFSISNSGLLDIKEHHNKEKYPNQKILYVKYFEYVYCVPYVEQSGNTIFLKTFFPSRKATKYYS